MRRSDLTTLPRRLVLALSLLLVACDRGAPTPAEGAAKDEPAQRASPAEATARPDDRCAPLLELAAMDPRSPVPLQPMMAWHQKQNMMQHLVAIQRITQGLVDEDWEEIAEASALIETSPQMKTMCEHMGAGAEGFTELALDFHTRADGIGAAARDQDGPAVLKATAHTLKACTTCHAAYRQDVVDATTWQAATGSSHDPGAMSHGN